jgi:hypothetical protein
MASVGLQKNEDETGLGSAACECGDTGSVFAFVESAGHW